jgi:hypothetical protein
MKKKIYLILEYLWYSTFINGLIFGFIYNITGSLNNELIILTIPLLTLILYETDLHILESMKELDDAVEESLRK